MENFKINFIKKKQLLNKSFMLFYCFILIFLIRKLVLIIV